MTMRKSLLAGIFLLLTTKSLVVAADDDVLAIGTTVMDLLTSQQGFSYEAELSMKLSERSKLIGFDPLSDPKTIPHKVEIEFAMLGDLFRVKQKMVDGYGKVMFDEKMGFDGKEYYKLSLLDGDMGVCLDGNHSFDCEFHRFSAHEILLFPFSFVNSEAAILGRKVPPLRTKSNLAKAFEFLGKTSSANKEAAQFTDGRVSWDFRFLKGHLYPEYTKLSIGGVPLMTHSVIRWEAINGSDFLPSAVKFENFVEGTCVYTTTAEIKNFKKLDSKSVDSFKAPYSEASRVLDVDANR